MSMRTTSWLAAAAASVLSIGLVASAGATSADHIAGRATCVGGGTLRVGGTVDGEGNAKTVAHMHDTGRKHWTGIVMAGVDPQSVSDTSAEDVEKLTHKYVTTDGDLVAVATRSGATAPGSMAVFMTSDLNRICMATVLRHGRQYAVSGAADALVVGTGDRQAVAAFAMGKPNHRYRARFTLTGKGGLVQHRVRTQTVKKSDFGVGVTVRDFQRLAAFQRIAVRIVDLTDPKAKPVFEAVVR
jgi:hypothetical protein